MLFHAIQQPLTPDHCRSTENQPRANWFEGCAFGKFLRGKEYFRLVEGYMILVIRSGSIWTDIFIHTSIWEHISTKDRNRHSDAGLSFDVCEHSFVFFGHRMILRRRPCRIVILSFASNSILEVSVSSVGSSDPSHYLLLRKSINRRINILS
jgi:hypothetical protein